MHKSDLGILLAVYALLGVALATAFASFALYFALLILVVGVVTVVVFYITHPTKKHVHDWVMQDSYDTGGSLMQSYKCSRCGQTKQDEIDYNKYSHWD